MAKTQPTHSFTLSFNGLSNKLITPVHVCLPFDPKTPPTPLPAFTQANALWDTGATHSAISRRLAEKLKLVSVADGIVTHAGGTSTSNRYIINLGLPNKILVAGVYVNELELAGFDVLVGMDIITQGDFALTHVNGKTLFSFRTPSIESVDFVTKTPTVTSVTAGVNDLCPCGSGRKFKKCCKNKV